MDADDLYEFDRVDELDDIHQIRFGMRNKIQRKIEDQPFDLVDLDTYTVGRLERDGDEPFIENLYFDAEIASPNWLVLQVDGRYDIQESEMTVLNTRLAARRKRAYEVGLEHRFRLDDSSLLTGDVTVCPGRPWELSVYSRYEAEDARFEEHAGHIQRNLDCMSIRTGFVVEPGYTRGDGSEKEDDWRVIVSLWLTAFPDIKLKGRHHQ